MIAQEIIGAYLIPNDSPDFEGLSLLLEDSSYLRVGMDEIYTPGIVDFVIFDSRLIGFSAKFGLSTWNGKNNPGEMGLITDRSSCE